MNHIINSITPKRKITKMMGPLLSEGIYWALHPVLETQTCDMKEKTRGTDKVSTPGSNQGTVKNEVLGWPVNT